MSNEKPVRIVPHETYPNMYRLQWANGDTSVGTSSPKPWKKGGHYGFYNKTWALHILNNYEEVMESMGKRHPPIDLDRVPSPYK